MRIAVEEELGWTQYPGTRSVTIRYKPLLQGNPIAKDNYEMAYESFGPGDSFSPRHRHNFEQFRWAFDEPLNYSPKLDVPPGHLGYFPEGAYYGPQTILSGSHMLIVQFAGPNGYGYMSWEALARGASELQQKGEFVKGIYTYTNAEGKKVNQDAYEAVWEHVNGRKLEYPPARYREPVVIKPEAFPWMPVKGAAAGIMSRNFGVFNERGTSAYQVMIPAGASYRHAAVPNVNLFFFLSGRGTIAGEAYSPKSGVDLLVNESVEVAAWVDTVILGFVMPSFADQAGTGTG